MSEEREMTLQEWCAKLPGCHLVNRELRELEAEVARWKRDYDVDCFRLIKRIEAAESTLRAVAELPRFDIDYSEYDGMCRVPRALGDFVDADELETLLKKGGAL